MRRTFQKTKLFVSVAVALAVATSTSAASGPNIKQKGSWLVGLKALTLSPQESSESSIGGEAVVGLDRVPELDIRYFFTDSIAVETILGYTEHSVSADNTELGDVDLGSTKVLPPTLTLQYHFNHGQRFSPYLGAGLNYTFFYEHNPGDALDIEYDNGFGVAFNVGFDYALGEKNYLNLDIKKYWLSTKTTIDAGLPEPVTASVDLNPIAISIGYGWVF